MLKNTKEVDLDVFIKTTQKKMRVMNSDLFSRGKFIYVKGINIFKLMWLQMLCHS